MTAAPTPPLAVQDGPRAWRMLVHLAIPLAGVAGWELVRTGKQRILGLLAMAIALVSIADISVLSRAFALRGGQQAAKG